MTTIGRYEIIESQGAGSMGTVYRARDTILDREVALKTIHTGTSVEPELRERFYREAKACARLQHPGIVSVYDLGDADGVAFIAMELLVGTDFRKAIDQRTEVPLVNKIEAMCQVCDALSHAHKHGIIHRDIKPSNLFLMSDMRAKVLDFGIARLPSSQLTVAGQILGTPNYMAPEQILSKPADTRSDLFSAALVFFEFLVYSHPFKSPMIPRRVVEGEPDSILDYDSSLPAPLDRIFVRALAKDPDQRYRSGIEFADDLRTLLDSMRKDASPSFSRTVLPSDRDIRKETPNLAPQAVVDLTLVKQPPPGEDPYEWRLSEVLRLVPEFEEAIDRGDATQAERLLRELEAINSVDSRFGDTLAFCRTLFAKIAPAPPAKQAPVASPPQAVQPPPTIQAPPAPQPPPTAQFPQPTQFSPPTQPPPRTTQEPETPLRSSPSSATSLFNPTLVNLPVARPPLADPPPSKPAPLPIEPMAATPPVAPPKPMPPAGIPPAARVPAWRSPLAMVLAAAVVLIAALLVVRMLMVKPVRVEASIGKGVVSAPESAIYQEADGQSAIVQLSNGQRVNLLEPPRSKDQEWIRAQFVPATEKASRPGYLRLHDLDVARLEMADANAQLALIRLLLGDSTDAGTMQLEEEALKAMIGRFPGAPATSDADLRVAQIEVNMAKLLKDGGQAEPVWASHLDGASQYLGMAGNDPALSARADQLKRQIAELTLVAKPSAAPTPPTTIARQLTPAVANAAATGKGTQGPDQLKNLLDQAEVVYKSGTETAEQRSNLRTAEDLVRRALKLDPRNGRAEGLLRQIKDLQALLP